MEKNKEYIYLLQTIDENNNSIYKIGHKKDIKDIFKNYKFKNILFILTVEDSLKLKKCLIKIIKNKYKIAINDEYFYCDNDNEKELINFIISNALNIESINNKIDKVILEHKLYNYQKDIELKLLEEYTNKINDIEKINKDKYDSIVIQMNNKIEYLEKINKDKYDLIIIEMNNKIKDLEKIHKDKYDSMVIEMNNKIKDLEKLNNDKYDLIENLIEKNKYTNIIKDIELEKTELENILKYGY
jgi:hypothetical protein